MKWITLLFISLIFINLFVHSLSQFKFNAFSFIKLFADLEFGQVETIVHRYKSTTDEYQYNKLKCLKQLKVLKNDVMNGKTWALKTLDAWGKIPSGLLSLNVNDLGNFDQCLSLNEQIGSAKNITFKGQYCVCPFYPKIISENTLKGIEEFILMWPKSAQCVPATCSPQLWKAILEGILNDTFLGTKIVPALCQTVDDRSVTHFNEIVLYILIGLAIIVVVSTVYDTHIKWGDKIPNRLGTIFSLRTNLPRLFSLKNQTGNTNVIQCLDGIRTLTIFWVILTHIFVNLYYITLVNPLDLIKFLTSRRGLIFFASQITMDTFLFITGILTVINLFKYWNITKGNFNILAIYFQRYLRMTPLLVVTIMYIIYIERYIGNGPFWKYMTNIRTQKCVSRWWMPLVYIQNYKDPWNGCPVESWYAAVDMQVFIIAPFLLWPIWKWGYKGMILIIAILIASIIYNFQFFYVNNYRTVDVIKVPDLFWTVFEEIQFTTHIKIQGWICGVIFGLILIKTQNVRIIIPNVMLISVWLASLSIMYWVIFAPYDFMIEEEVILYTSIYHAIQKICWCSAMSWLIWACHNGYGGIINSLLSLKIWRIFGLLSYCMYLIQNQVITYNFGTTRTPFYFSFYNLMLQLLLTIALTFLISILVYVIIEYPLVKIGNLIFYGGKSRNQTIGNSDKLNVKSNQIELTTKILTIENNTKNGD